MKRREKPCSGRPKDSRNKVPPTPHSLWDENYPAVPSSAFAETVARTIEIVRELEGLLTRPESWQKDPQACLEEEWLKYGRGRGGAGAAEALPWIEARDRNMVRWWLRDWVFVVSSGQARREEFGVAYASEAPPKTGGDYLPSWHVFRVTEPIASTCGDLARVMVQALASAAREAIWMGDATAFRAAGEILAGVKPRKSTDPFFRSVLEAMERLRHKRTYPDGRPPKAITWATTPANPTPNSVKVVRADVPCHVECFVAGASFPAGSNPDEAMTLPFSEIVQELTGHPKVSFVGTPELEAKLKRIKRAVERIKERGGWLVDMES